MSDMRRLRDETRSPFARALLESVEEDRPENGACDRALGALGLGTAGVIAAGTAAKAATVVAGSAVTASSLPSSLPAVSSASSLAPAASKGGFLVLVKWIGIGVLGSAVTIGSMAYVEKEAPSPSPRGIASSNTTSQPVAAGAISEPRAPAAGDAPIAPPSIGRPAAATTEDARRAAEPTREPSARTASSPAAEEHVARTSDGDGSESNAVAPRAEAPLPIDPVTTQLSALSAIRASLASGDPARAIALLDAFEARNPASPFGEETAVLRIDALVDAGRNDEASALSIAFTNAHPQSAYGQHVRSKTKSP